MSMAKKEALLTGITKTQEETPSGDIRKQKSNRGRKAESCNVRLEPIFREEPDIEMLGRALIAMAVHAVDKEIEAKQKEQNA